MAEAASDTQDQTREQLEQAILHLVTAVEGYNREQHGNGGWEIPIAPYMAAVASARRSGEELAVPAAALIAGMDEYVERRDLERLVYTAVVHRAMDEVERLLPPTLRANLPPRQPNWGDNSLDEAVRQDKAWNRLLRATQSYNHSITDGWHEGAAADAIIPQDLVVDALQGACGYERAGTGDTLDQQDREAEIIRAVTNLQQCPLSPANPYTLAITEHMRAAVELLPPGQQRALSSPQSPSLSLQHPRIVHADAATNAQWAAFVEERLLAPPAMPTRSVVQQISKEQVADLLRRTLSKVSGASSYERPYVTLSTDHRAYCQSYCQREGLAHLAPAEQQGILQRAILNTVYGYLKDQPAVMEHVEQAVRAQGPHDLTAAIQKRFVKAVEGARANAGG